MGKSKGMFLKIVGRFLLYFLFLTISWVFLYRFIDPPLTPLMFIRFIDQVSYQGENQVFKRQYIPYKDISPDLVHAVVVSEDQKFAYHAGFDFKAMEKAYESNKRGRKIKGGSTISQQVAKNVFLWPGRSYFRKIAEAYFTVLIEILWSKERIMEVYLNVIEMGEGIYGAEAASRHYFRKSCSRLTRGESALLAAILPNPRKYSARNPSSYVYSRKLYILGQMAGIRRPEF